MLRTALRTALAAICLAAVPAYALEDKEIVIPGLAYPMQITLQGSQKAGAVLFESRFSETPGATYDTVLLEGEMPDAAIRLDVVLRSGFFLAADKRYQPETLRRFPRGRSPASRSS